MLFARLYFVGGTFNLGILSGILGHVAVELMYDYSILHDEFLASDEAVHTTRTEYKQTRENINNPCMDSLQLHRLDKSFIFCGDEFQSFRPIFYEMTRRKTCLINEGLIPKAAHRTCSGSLKSWMQNGQLVSTTVLSLQ